MGHRAGPRYAPLAVDEPALHRIGATLSDADALLRGKEHRE